QQQPRSETEALRTDAEPELGRTVAPEPPRVRRSEEAFQWEFPEPDRQPVFREPRRKGRHRTEKRGRRRPEEELQPAPGAGESEPVPRIQREEEVAQASPQGESVPVP